MSEAPQATPDATQATQATVVEEMLSEAVSVMELAACGAAAEPVATIEAAAPAPVSAAEPVLGAKELKIQSPVGGEIVVPLDEVRRVYGDVWVPAEGQRTRSGRQVKPVKRFVQEVYEDDETDEEDEEMSTDEEDREEANSEDEAFVADDDEEEELAAEAGVDEEEESSADSAETEDEEEEVYSGESDDEDEDDDDFFSSSSDDQ
jgi:Mg-chelatase subunit ChlI